MDTQGGIWVAVPFIDMATQPWFGGAVRYNSEGKITHHVGIDCALAIPEHGMCVAVMLDDDCNLYMVCSEGAGGYSPKGVDNASIQKFKAPFPAARIEGNANYCAGYC